MKLLAPIPVYLKSLTLKQRIVFILAASTLIPFVCTALLSYHAMSSILASKLDSSVRSNIKQVQASLENTISNLNYVSQQLSFQGTTGKKLERYLLSTDPYERMLLNEEIKTDVNLISLTNPNIRLTMFYFEQEDRYLYENFGVKSEFSIDALPLIAEYFRMTYYGPHASYNQFTNRDVISALRQVGLPHRDDAYIYIESDFDLTPIIMDSDGIGQHSYYLILDNDNRIAYSQLTSLFPVDSYYYVDEMDDYYSSESKSNQGWSLVSLIPKTEYNRERDLWVVQIYFLFVLFIAISLMIAWVFWKMVYKPLFQFNQEINRTAQNVFQSDAAPMNIPEFDYLLRQFRNMKLQIGDLFKEVEIKEQKRANLEIEKLLYQINPHFLMNTLDTIHWLAVMNGQHEIDRLVLSLNKLLYNNLGKLGKISTIREEIDSLKQYLILQQIRYDFQFDVRIEVEDEVMDRPVPRFILQPIVENALYHGLNDEGYIQVEVKSHEYLEILVHDNGGGMSDKEILELLNRDQQEHEKVGMGIGMNYVKRMLDSYYDGKAKLEINSESGKGTTVGLYLPVYGEENRNDD